MKPFALLLIAMAATLPSRALAWGYEGHQVIALIARSRLTPAVRAKVDALLATDTDSLTGHDLASEATWADAYRGEGHRETAQWHFVDQELDGSADLRTACFGSPPAARPASAGPAQDCVVDRIDEFAAELAAPDTALQERLLALKFLLHLVGDVHQPLHASDNHDRGGNCVLVSLGGARAMNLHSYWDTAVVEAMGRDPQRVATALLVQITPAQADGWRRGTAADWAREAFAVARSTAYTIGSPPGCQSDAAPRPLPPGYAERAENAAALQLEKAGVRLAAVLERALAEAGAPQATRGTGRGVVPAARAPAAGPPAGTGARTKTPGSPACSAEADARDLHGVDRRRFRRRCMRGRWAD